MDKGFLHRHLQESSTLQEMNLSHGAVLDRSGLGADLDTWPPT